MPQSEFQLRFPVLRHWSQQAQRRSLEAVRETAFFRDDWSDLH